MQTVKQVLKKSVEYLKQIYNLSKYFGQTEVAFYAAMILHLITARADVGEYLTRQDIGDYLHISYSNLQRPLEFLKKHNLIRHIYINDPTHYGSKHDKKDSKKDDKPKEGKAFVPTLDFTAFAKTEEEYWDFYLATLDNGWYDDMDTHWGMITIIHILEEWGGLGTPLSSRRNLFYCLCMDCNNCCSYSAWKKAKQDLLTIKADELQRRFVEHKDYGKEIKERMSQRKKKTVGLAKYQTAKRYFYINDETKKEKYLSEQSDEIKTAVEKAVKSYDELNKRNIFLYCYFVTQPLLGDTDFSERSIFYGRTLEERRSLLEKIIHINCLGGYKVYDKQPTNSPTTN